jgi:hypothetical protein
MEFEMGGTYSTYGGRAKYIKNLVVKPERRDSMIALIMDDRIILKSLKEIGGEDMVWRQEASSCEHGNEPWDSIKGWESVD